MDKENKLSKSREKIKEKLYEMALENIQAIKKQRDILDVITKKLVEVDGSYTDVINRLRELKDGVKNE